MSLDRMRIAALLSSAILLAAGPALSQGRRDQPWHRIQMPTAAQVLARWRAPPPEYGPEPYYGIGASVSDEQIAAELDRVKGLGFQAITVQWGPRLPFGYLTPEYFAWFKRFVAAAKQRNMRIWIVDDAGYPSGFAGGKFTNEAPALRMKALVASGNWTIAGGQTLDEAAPADFVSASAIDANGEAHSITAQNGRLHWTAPPGGSWRVIAVSHAFRTSATRSDTNPTHKKDDTHSLHDYLDPAAVTQYLRFTHEAYKKAVGDEFGKTILGFRGDEPDYSVTGLPWTTAFFDRFAELKGYDPKPYLPALLQGRDAKLSERQSLVRADYYEVFSLMFAAAFFKLQSDWCAANGLQYQVHLNHEERQIEFGQSEGDFFRDNRSVQSIGVDAIWHQLWTDTVSDFPRFGSSAAHLNGRPQAMTETFAAYRPEPDLTIVRYGVNEQLVRGINLFEFMYVPGGQPTRSFFADPAFPEITAYTRSASYLMSMGRPDARVAVLQSRGAMWMRDHQADDMFVSTERLLSEAQVDFDIVDEDAVGNLMKAQPGMFETASGNRYRTIVIPQPDLMPIAVVRRLRAFAQGGGKVLFLGRTPPRIVETTYAAARRARPDEFAWASLDRGTLSPVPTPPANPWPKAPDPLVVSGETLAAVRAAVAGEDLSLAQPDTALRYTHRQLSDATVFFLFNESGRPFHGDATLRGNGTRLERWDPQTSRVAPIAASSSAGAHRTTVDLPAYGAMVLVLRR